MTSRGLVIVPVLAALAAGCSGPQGADGAPGPVGPPGSPGPTAPPPSGETFEIEIRSASVVVTTANLLQVEIAITDDDGAPRSREDLSISFTAAALVPDEASGEPTWMSYVLRPASGAFGSTEQPTADSQGTWAEIGWGSYRYTFRSRLPAGYPEGATHRVALYARRTPDEGAPEYDNAYFDFVPAGTALGSKVVATTEACNSCHAGLELHGGPRRDLELCVTCHTPQLFDPDTENTSVPGEMNPLDMDVMTHRIHMGHELPSVVAAQQGGVVGYEYHVVGYGGADYVYGATVPDNKDADLLPQLSGVAFPMDLRNCATCHTADAPEAASIETTVSRAACSSCHDTTWFGAGPPPPRMVAHTAGPMADDAACSGAACHVADLGEFDRSISGAHVSPLHSTQLLGLGADIVSVGVVGTGVEVSFSITYGGSPLAPPLDTSVITSCAIVINGPTTDYDVANFYRADVRSLMTPSRYDAASGRYTIVLPARTGADLHHPNEPVIPFGVTGTFAAGIDVRRATTLAGSGGSFVVTEPPNTNDVTYFSVDGLPPLPRRTVVDQASCNTCHDTLLFHGGQRRDIDHCVLCHNPRQTDWARRPKAGGNVNLAATEDGLEERSVDFKVMIHKIHTGEDLDESDPYVLYGFGASINVFDEVRFPGKRNRCQTCHAGESYLLEAVPDGALPTLANETGTIRHAGNARHVPGENEVPPITAACLSCHDTSGARVHAELNTNASGEEACVVCHGQGREFSVDEIHENQ